jgi:hypothetical protein
MRPEKNSGRACTPDSGDVELATWQSAEPGTLPLLRNDGRVRERPLARTDSAPDADATSLRGASLVVSCLGHYGESARRDRFLVAGAQALRPLAALRRPPLSSPSGSRCANRGSHRWRCPMSATCAVRRLVLVDDGVGFTGLQQREAEGELDHDDQQLDGNDHRHVQQHVTPRKMLVHIYYAPLSSKRKVWRAQDGPATSLQIEDVPEEAEKYGSPRPATCRPGRVLTRSQPLVAALPG